MNGENNLILIIGANGTERQLGQNETITGLTIRIFGSNNVVRLHEPLRFNDCFFDIRESNNYVDIGSPEWEINNLYMIFVDGGNCVFKIAAPIYISSMKIFFSEQGCQVLIDSQLMCSWDVTLMPTDGHSIFQNALRKRTNIITNPITIGKHVWLGCGVFVGKNVSIPDNTVVGTKAVVTHSFEKKNTIIAGNPAKIVKENISWSKKLADNFDDLEFYSAEESSR